MANIFRGAQAQVNRSDLSGRRVWKGGAPPWWLAGGAACIWAAYQPKGAANFAASLVDLSGLGNNAGDPGAPATPPWDAVNGWRPDGIADYLTTAFVPQADQTQTLIVQFTNAPISDTSFLAGSSAGGNRNFLLRPRAVGTSVTYFNGGFVTVAPGLTSGNLCIAGNRGYRTGAAEGGAAGAWAGASIAVYLCAYNGVGVATGFTASNIQALALYDCALTAPQVAAVAAAMALL